MSADAKRDGQRLKIRAIQWRHHGEMTLQWSDGSVTSQFSNRVEQHLMAELDKAYALRSHARPLTGETPRVDAEHETSPEDGPVPPTCYGRMVDLARQLERELVERTDERDAAVAEGVRLEKRLYGDTAASTAAAPVTCAASVEGRFPGDPSPESSTGTTGPYEPPMVYDPMHGMVKPGGDRALMSELRQLYDKTAEAYDGDYPDKVNHALVAVYAFGQRRARVSATRPTACPYCTSANEAIRGTYYDQTCEGCVKRMCTVA